MRIAIYSGAPPAEGLPTRKQIERRIEAAMPQPAAAAAAAAPSKPPAAGLVNAMWKLVEAIDPLNNLDVESLPAFLSCELNSGRTKSTWLECCLQYLPAERRNAMGVMAVVSGKEFYDTGLRPPKSEWTRVIEAVLEA